LDEFSSFWHDSPIRIFSEFLQPAMIVRRHGEATADYRHHRDTGDFFSSAFMAS
jgi:hypothetical protein